MTEDYSQPSEPLYPILHHTKEKHRQLGASLLLTSSLISHKQKIAQHRQEQIDTRPLGNLPLNLLKTSKINITQIRVGDGTQLKALSNIQALKYQARKLEQQQVIKLGKQNKNIDTLDTIERNQPLVDLLKPTSKPKKMNKRKIVKGRPQMYALVKKRKFLAALADDRLAPREEGSDQATIRHTINEILNKNNILKFITTKNSHQQQHNLYENFLREQNQVCEGWTQRQSRLKFRRTSAAVLKNTHHPTEHSEKDTHRRVAAKRHFSVNYKRYSVSNTIQ